MKKTEISYDKNNKKQNKENEYDLLEIRDI